MTDETCKMSHADVCAEGWRHTPSEEATVIDGCFLLQYPQIVDPTAAKRSLRHGTVAQASLG